MFSSIKRFVQNVARATRGANSRKQPARRAVLSLETLETRVVLSGSPISGGGWWLSANGDLYQGPNHSGTRVDSSVQDFKVDNNGNTYALHTTGEVVEWFAGKGKHPTIATGVSSLGLNASGVGIELLHGSGELDEFSAQTGLTSKLATGVTDFKENAKGTIDVRHSNGELDDVNPLTRQATKLAADVAGADDFQERSTGAVDLRHSSTGEVDDVVAGKTTKLATGVSDFKENERQGALEVRHASGEVDEVSSSTLKTSVVATGVTRSDDYKVATSTGAVDVRHSSTGELDEFASGKTTKLATGVKDFGEHETETTHAVDLLFSSGEVDELQGTLKTKLSDDAVELGENAGGEVDVLRKTGELDEVIPQSKTTTILDKGVQSFTETAEGFVRRVHGEAGDA